MMHSQLHGGIMQAPRHSVGPLRMLHACMVVVPEIARGCSQAQALLLLHHG